MPAANGYLVIDAASSSAGLIALLPSEGGGGVSNTLDEQVAFSKKCQRLYQEVIPAISGIVARTINIDLEQSQTLMQIACVPLLQFFFDRLARLAKAKAQLGIVSVLDIGAYEPHFDFIEEFQNEAHASRQFNQRVLSFLAPVLNLKVYRDDAGLFAASSRVTRNDNQGAVNTLFVDPGRKIAAKATWRDRLAHNLLLKPSYFLGHIPAIDLTTSTTPLLRAGFFGFGRLRHIDRKRLKKMRGTKNLVLRQGIFNELIDQVWPAIEAFFTSVTGCQEAPSLREILIEYLALSFPTAQMEGAAQHLVKYSRLLRGSNSKYAVFSSLGFNSESALLIAATQKLKITAVNMQHGGHYGYLDDFVSVEESEYQLAPHFLSWGWTAMPEHPRLKNSVATPLPNPWLGNRKVQWQMLRDELGIGKANKEFDLLLMPNKIYVYPPAPYGAQSTVDYLPKIAEMLLGVVRAAQVHRIRILHKPYNSGTCQLLANTLTKMADIGGDSYAVVDLMHKGLTPENIRRCHLVLWDQPGTGFLECLAGGIPSLVLWQRIYNRENSIAAPYFLQLEQCGLVHSSPSSLMQEVLRFKDDPQKWLANPDRIRAAALFSDKFGLAKADWQSDWRQFLIRLKQGTAFFKGPVARLQDKPAATLSAEPI